MKLTLKNIARLPILITGICLIVGFIVLFVWSVDKKLESHVNAGTYVLRYLIEFESVNPKDCSLESNELGSAVILKKNDGSKFNLLEWVGRERARGEESELGQLLKEKKLSFDQVPVASCRVWRKIVDALNP